MSVNKADIEPEIIDTHETNTQQKPRRISSLDATRGLAMIFILLLVIFQSLSESSSL